MHNGDMETTVPGLYVAGDLAGIEEASTAMEEGKLAGVAVAEALGKITPAAAQARKAEIEHSLSGLRQGPFGEGRAKAQERITWQR